MHIERHEPSPAYLLRTDDQALQVYLQTYPFLTGPNERDNLKGVELVHAGLIRRSPADSVAVHMLGDGDGTIPPDIEASARTIGVRANLSRRRIDTLLAEFGWKLAVAGINPTSILSFGAVGGDELVALRAFFPVAIIDAIDWSDCVKPGILASANIKFAKRNLVEALSECRQYDLIFSNHTLEHFSDPDAVVAGLRRWLRHGGVLVSGLPLDGTFDDHYCAKLALWAADSARVDMFDMGWLDPGHAWKTNAADVADTLRRGGFSDIQLFQRSWHLTRGLPYDKVALRRYRSRLGLLNSAWNFATKGAIRLFSPAQPSYLLRKVFFALQHRCFWSDNRFKNAQAPEIVFVARHYN